MLNIPKKTNDQLKFSFKGIAVNYTGVVKNLKKCYQINVNLNS